MTHRLWRVRNGRRRKFKIRKIGVGKDGNRTERSRGVGNRRGISPDRVELARKRFEVMHVSTENVQFMVGSAYDITLADESVDVVFGIGILHHLDLKLAQKEVYRILRKGGVAIF